jgi:hypothetical protein
MHDFNVNRIGSRLWLMIALLPAAFCLEPIGANGQDAEQLKNWQQLTLNYTGAAVQVTEARLAIANALNKKVPGTISADEIGELTLLLDLARARQRSLDAGDPADDSTAFVVESELLLKREERAYSQLRKVAVGAALSADNLDLAKDRVQFAKSRVALAKGLAGQSSEVRRRWEIQLLIDELETIRRFLGNPETAK